MMKRISILSSLFFFVFFLSCKKEAGNSIISYNQKANELIKQIVMEDSCDCILEIPNTSLIQISVVENPVFDIRKIAIKGLHLKNKTELDSLEKVTKHFVLDSLFFKRKKIKIIKEDSLAAGIKNLTFLKTCPKGILSIQKPIFGKDYKTAMSYYGHVFTCIGSAPVIYRYEKGKWIRNKF